MSAEDAASFQFLAENSTDVICRAGADTVLHYVSPSSFRILGWKPEEMIGKRPDDFILSAKTASFLPDQPHLRSRWISLVRMRKKDGTIAWIEIRHRVVCDSAYRRIRRKDHRDARHHGAQDIWKSSSLLLEFTDSRTGLSTHRAFDEALEREWNRTLREGSEISLLLLDFDHFRQFHDWRQHREGDRCLAKAAAAVIGALRITDFAARYGAEDIAIILPSTDSGGAARGGREGAVCHPASPLCSAADSGKSEGRLTVSMGIATVSARRRRNRENAGTPASRSRQCAAESQANQNRKKQTAAACRSRTWRALRVNLDPVISHLWAESPAPLFQKRWRWSIPQACGSRCNYPQFYSPWFLTCHSFLPGDRSGSDRNTPPPRAPADGRRGRSSSSCSAKISNSGFSASRPTWFP